MITEKQKKDVEYWLRRERKWLDEMLTSYSGECGSTHELVLKNNKVMEFTEEKRPYVYFWYEDNELLCGRCLASLLENGDLTVDELPEFVGIYDDYSEDSWSNGPDDPAICSECQTKFAYIEPEKEEDTCEHGNYVGQGNKCPKCEIGY